MGRQVTITAKIPEHLKKRLDSLEVNVSGLVRKALEQEVERAERARIQKLADEAGRILLRIPGEELVKAVRESRETR